MALGTNKVASFAAPGMAAAATARPVSGGRNVASATGQPLEGSGFSQQIGVNDNALLRYEDDLGFDSGDKGQQQQEAYTPLLSRAAAGFRVDEAEEELNSTAPPRLFLAEVMRGVGVYEHNMRVTTPGTVKPGSVLNFLF
ncbi:MAG: hypothetical protein ACM33T_13615 [Solirubrobacterales bacterium]